MARRAFIPITDHNDGNSCTNYYDVRYKISSFESWTTLTQQQAEGQGSPVVYGIVLDNLDDDVAYDYEITRHCCEGNNSIAATGSFNTTLT